MGDNKQQIEWLANADACQKMADRLKDPELRARWLTLAQNWLALCGPAASAKSASEPPTATERFETALQDKGTGQKRSESSN